MNQMERAGRAKVSQKRVRLITLTLLLTFAIFRIYLHAFPDTDLNLGPYNIHHLYTGLILIAAGGIPLAIFHGEGRWLDLAALVFGVGLSMALDEWVYLITTDGTNASYPLPISFWGGAVMTGLACGYIIVLYLYARRAD
jgi:hypothetical protein